MEHNNEFTRITEEVRGTEATQKMAMMEAERRVQEERLKNEKERAILYSTLPDHVADRLIKGEDVSGDKHDNACVLFLDVVGFTTHTSSMDPHDTTTLLAEIFERFDEICKQHSVTKVKTIGDSYMAVGFEGADRVAQAAVEMTAASFTWPDESPIQFRIGVHSGPVVAGVIGKERLQYDVWGDTVNTASRMESTGEPGRIQCSESFERSFATAQDDVAQRHSEGRSDEEPLFNFTERGAVEVKGKGKMTTYWLEGA